MAEDVLGITGLVNIDDIQKTFDKLIGDLERLGVSTDEISARMTKALNDIANSSEKDLAAKTTAAMKVLNEAIAETNSNLRSTPEMIKNAEQEATRLQTAVSKLEKELGGTAAGSKEFNALTQQLENERETLRLQTADVQDMKAAHEHAAQTIQHLQSIYDSFVATLREKSDAEQESTNAAETQAQTQEQATQTTQEATQAVEQQTQAHEAAADAARKHTAAEKEHAGSQQEIQAAIDDTQKTIDELVAKQEKAQKRMESLRKNMQAWAASGIEKGYIQQTGEGQYKADPKAAGYNENVIAQMQKIAKEYNALKQSLQSYKDEETLARQGLKELKESLQEVEQQTQQNTRANEQTKQSSPRQMLMELRNEITMLTLQYRNMTDAERASAEGQALQKKLEELKNKAATLQDAFSDVQETIKNDANDTAAFKGLTQGLNLVISGFGAAQGAAAAFGMSEEDLARAQTAIQGSLAATNFLTEAGNALQEQSALMRGINTLQTWAAAKAIDVETAAKGRNIVATKAATVAQGIFNAIAKANPYVLLAMALITVVGALAAFTIGSKKAADAEKKQKEEAEKLAEQHKHMAETIGSATGNVEAKYRSLQHQWAKLRTEAEKTKWIKDNASNFDSLGLAVKGVNDAEKVLVEMAPQVIAALKAVAKATAFEDLYKEAIIKKAKEWENRVKGVETGDKYYTVTDREKRTTSQLGMPSEWEKAGLKINEDYTADFQDRPGNAQRTTYELTKKGVDKINKYRNDQAVALRKRLEGEYDKEIQHYSDMWDNALLEAEEAKKKIPTTLLSGGTTTTTPTKPTKKEPEYKSAAELNDELLALRKERIEKELELEKEGSKRWAELERERIRTQAEIDSRAARQAGNEAVADLDASYKGGKSGMTEQQYKERRAALEQQTQDIIKAIEAKSQQDLADIDAQRVKAQQERDDELISQYQSYIDKKLQIDKDYADALKRIDEAIAEAKERGDTDRVAALTRSRAQAAQTHNEQQANLSLQQLKETPDYVRAFEDLGNTSTQTLEFLIKQFEEAKQAAATSLDPEKLREYTSTLQQMYDELNNRNPFVALTTSAQELTEAEQKLSIASANVVRARQNVKLAKQAGDAHKLAEAEKILTDAEKKERQATDDVEKAKNKYKKALKSTLEKVNELADAIANVGNAIGGTEGQILGIAANVMTFMTQTIDGIKAVTATGVAALSTLEKASVILTIISAAIQLFQQISSMFKDAHSQYEAYAEKFKEINQLRDAVNDYKLAVIEATNAEKRWFATTGLASLQDMYEYSNMALESYIAKMYEAQAIYQNESGGGWLTNALSWLGNLVSDIVSIPGKLITGALDKMGILDKDSLLGQIMDWGITGLFGGAEGLIGKGVGALLDTLNYDEGTTAAFKNLRIETREKSSGFLGTGIGGHSQRTEDLREWVKANFGKDLFGSDGMIDVQLAQTVIDKYGDKLVGETKATLEELIKLKQEYDKFREQLEEYISEMYAPLTDNMTDALWDWLKDGKDVMDSFKKYASDTFADIAKEMIKQALLTKVFDGFQDKLANLYEVYSMGGLTEKQLTDGIMQATDALLNKAENQLPVIQDVLTYIDEQFKARGFDITGSEAYEQQGSSGAWQQLGEDTGQELNGRFTALQITGESILVQSIEQTTALLTMQQEIVLTRTEIVSMSSNVDTIRETQEDMLSTLEQIQKNTYQLHEIKEDIKLLVENTKNI